ncbi:MAG: hypothetical protein N3D74_01445 [Caldisericia bacterium]|nr:hypothetical protein [Caldisericia bacterium]
MNEGINLDDIKLTYKLLNHKGPTELRILKEGVYPIVKFVNNESDFLKECILFNGKRNIYAGIRDRKIDIKFAARKEDIVGLNLTVIDIDPIRPKNLPSDDDELNRAIFLSEKIKDFFNNNSFKKLFRGMTGNGVSLFFVIPYYVINDENRYDIEDSLLWFENFIRDKFKKEIQELNLKIDNMYDLPRIVKVIGTKSIKGVETKDRPHRVSYWIDKPIKIEEDEKLLNFILNRGKENKEKIKPVWLMQPIQYFGENLNGDWIVEPKIDGWRLEVIKDKGNVLFFGRRLEKNPDWSYKLKISKDIFENVPDGTILDCELYSDKGRRFIPSLFSETNRAKPIIFVFDIIYYKGDFLGNLPLIKRKEILNKIKFGEGVEILKFKELSDIEKDLKEAISLGHEGIVIKEINSKYIIGNNSPIVTLYWKKIKGLRR